jgi:hypothetical protein
MNGKESQGSTIDKKMSVIVAKRRKGSRDGNVKAYSNDRQRCRRNM